MDARRLLKSQGWRGNGHTLSSDDSTGLAKPLLISRKDNRLGIGKKEFSTTDQWWLNAFDQQLKGLDTSKQGIVLQTVTTGHLNAIACGTGKYKGSASLYASFVKGGQLEGTIISGGSTDATPGVEDAGREVVSPQRETKGERRARREEKRLKKAEKAMQRVQTEPADTESTTAETKEERRLRKEARRRRREARKHRNGGDG